MQTAAELCAYGLRLWQPPPRLSLSEWADEYAVLSSESAADAGRWSTLPYQRGIMDAFTDPLIDTVVCLKSARIGWTKILNHVVGYHIHQDPCPIMVVQPAVEDAEGYSKDEIAPMIRDTPCLRGLVSDPKAKDGNNTILSKSYPGGTLGMVGANSGRGFRRVSRRVVLFDEASAYRPISEGDQIKLGIRRSEYYWNRKIGIGSTPILKGFDKTETWYLRTDQRKYFVPCPDCGHYQVLRWTQMKWEKGKPETAAYECENCGVRIPHAKKRWMVDRGEWRATAKAERPGLVGFHIWAGYSYSPNATWEQLAREFLEVKGDREQLQTFVNTVLGETFEDEYAASLTAEGLMAKRLPLEPGVCAAGVVLLTCGVDVQDNRLAVSVWGWGDGEEGYLVWHQEVYGDPTQAAVWEQLDAIRSTAWSIDGGGELKIAQTAIDSGGHCTQEVYRYVRERKGEQILAIKGSSQRNQQAIGKGSAVDYKAGGQVVKRGARVYMVGGDTIKTTLFGRLRHQENGPGSLHFNLSADEEYFRQITAEKQQIRYVKGHPVREWVKKNADRNEALDTMVYAYAALQFVYRRYDRRTMWAQLAAQLQQAREMGTAGVVDGGGVVIKRKAGRWLSRE